MARASSRGFRLAELTLHEARRHDPKPFVTDGFNFSAVLEKAAADRLLHRKLTTPPSVGALGPASTGSFSDDPGVGVDDDAGPAVVFEIQELTRSGRRLSITYRSGAVGAFSSAVSTVEEETDVDVSDRAVINEQRAWLLLPPAGTGGLLVAESAGRSAGEHTLRRWLNEACRVTAGDGTAWRLLATPVSDPKHVEELLNEESMQEIVLSRREETADRSTRSEPFTLRAPLKTQYTRRQAADRLQGWLERRTNPLSVQEGARELAAIVDERFRDVEFDDGYVKAKGDDSGQQLRPDLARDIFTYSLGPGLRSEGAVLSEARQVVQRIQGLTEMELPWP